MLKVAIIGCGKIADSHLAQIQRVAGTSLAWVCDREPLMARQLFERFPIAHYGSDLQELLRTSKPDVVHITTPPTSHYDLAAECLDAGCHVYVEKPFTLDEPSTRRLLAMAQSRGLKITAGHDDQFSFAAQKMRALVREGYLGNGAIHMESTYCYELSSSGYAGAVLGDKKHWVRNLPGKLLHNIISHGIAKIAEYFTTESPEVHAFGFRSPLLTKMGEEEIIDELRVIIAEQNHATAYFTFSSQMRPGLHEFRIFGSKNGLVLDQNSETLIRLRGKKYTSYAEKFIPPAAYAGQYLQNLKSSLSAFCKNEFHMKEGMKFLIESFYNSITAGAPDPIPHREILLTAKIMDDIFRQLDSASSQVRCHEFATHV